MSHSTRNPLPPGQQLVAAHQWPTMGERAPRSDDSPWKVRVCGAVRRPCLVGASLVGASFCGALDSATGGGARIDLTTELDPAALAQLTRRERVFLQTELARAKDDRA